MASNDELMATNDDMGGAHVPNEPAGHFRAPEAPAEAGAEPSAKKPRKRLSALQNLSKQGNMSPMELSRIARSLISHVAPAPTVPEPQAVAPVELQARPRPAAGAMAEVCEIATHDRPKGQGQLHWKKYGELPPARVGPDGKKIYEWKGLFKEVRGHMKFHESDGGEVVSIPAAKVELWDAIKIRWLAKTYGRGRSERTGRLYNPLLPLPPANLMRTWHTSRQFRDII